MSSLPPVSLVHRLKQCHMGLSHIPFCIAMVAEICAEALTVEAASILIRNLGYFGGNALQLIS